MKVSMENDNNFGYEKISILVDNIKTNILLIHLTKVNVIISWHPLSFNFLKLLNAQQNWTNSGNDDLYKEKIQIYANEVDLTRGEDCRFKQSFFGTKIRYTWFIN